jgi:hypothetical protein
MNKNEEVIKRSQSIPIFNTTLINFLYWDKADMVERLLISNKKQRDPKESPVRKLSVKLLKTYNNINKIYYANKKVGYVKKKGLYNEGNHYIIKKDEMLQERYKVIEEIGKGVFGVVVKAIDTLHKDCMVAIKIIKNSSKFYYQSKIEIKNLKLLNEKDPDNKYY